MTELELKRSKELLDEIKKVMESHDSIKDINLFSILGMETKEVSAHSAFLFYIFEPFIDSQGNINCANLEALYNYLKTQKNDLPDNPKDLYIYREVPSEYGRMDFLIRYNNGDHSDAIVIELKVKAGEQDNQITRYRNYLKDNDFTENNVFFLTPDGHQSTTGQSFAISLEDMCNSISEEASNLWSDDYKTIFYQYINIIKIIKGGATNMDIGDVLQTKNDLLVVNELYKAKDMTLTRLLKEFAKKLNDGIASAISERDLKLELVRGFDENDIKNYYTKGTKALPSLVYSVKDLEFEKQFKEALKNGTISIEDEKDCSIYFVVEIEWKLYCGFSLRSCGNNNAYDLVKIKSKENIRNEKNVHLFESGWLSWEYIKCNGDKKIDFTEYDGADSFFNLIKNQSLEFDENNLKAIVNHITESFKNQYKLLMEKIPN